MIFASIKANTNTMKSNLILFIVASAALASCSVTHPGESNSYPDSHYSNEHYSTYDPYYNPYNDPYYNNSRYGNSNTYYYNGRYYTRPVYTRRVNTRPAYTRPVYVRRENPAPREYDRNDGRSRIVRRINEGNETRQGTPAPANIRHERTVPWKSKTRQ